MKQAISDAAKCEGCGELAPSFEIVHISSMEGKLRQLCNRCSNAEIAKLSGLDDFENIRLEPVILEDCDGQSHQFYFQS